MKVETRKILLFHGFAAAATAHGTVGGGLADQLRTPNRGDELLHSMIVEIDAGPLVIRFGDGAQAVLRVADGLPFGQNLHDASFEPPMIASGACPTPPLKLM